MTMTPGGADVEALHDPLALARPRSSRSGSRRRRGGRRPSGPVHPGAGVHGDADGLVDHDEGVVVVDDLDALDDLRDDRDRVDRRGDRHLEHRAAGDAVGLRRRAGRRAGTRPSRDELGRPGARQAEHPGDRGVDPLAGQAVGHVTVRWSCREPGRSRAGALASSAWWRRAGVRDAADRLEDDDAGSDVDADVRDVEDRPVRQLEEVDDVAAQEPGLAEEPVGEVAQHAAEQAAEPERPQPVLPSRRATKSTTTTAPTATSESTRVYDVPVLNAAPGLRTRLSWQEVADHRHGRPALEPRRRPGSW